MLEKNLYTVREQFPTRGDKQIRAQSIRGRMAMRGLHVPIAAPWYPEFRRELLTFPAGKNDDQVDALGLIGQILDRMAPGNELPGEAERPKVLSMDPALCTVTLDDLFEANEKKYTKGKNLRIH
jgi:hypothetical protein